MSDNVIIDLTNYRPRVSARIEEGTYLATVSDVEMDTSKAGNQMIVLFLKIIEEGPAQGADLVDRLTLTPNALFKVVDFMRAVGLNTDLKRHKLNTRVFRNRRVLVTVEDQTYQGKISSTVAAYAPAPGGSTVSAADEDDLDDEDIYSDSDDLEEVYEEAEEVEEEEEPKPKKKAKKAKKTRSVPVEEDDDEDDEDEDFDLDDLE